MTKVKITDEKMIKDKIDFRTPVIDNKSDENDKSDKGLINES